MQIEVIIALVVAIPVILFPAVLVWYANVGGICPAVSRVVTRRRQSGELRVGHGKQGGGFRGALNKGGL